MTDGDDDPHWATAKGPEASVDIRHLGITIAGPPTTSDLMVVAMSEALHSDLHGKTSSDKEFRFVAQEMASSASPAATTGAAQTDSPKYEVKNPHTMVTGRVLIEGYAPDWPERVWMCYLDESLG
jgi:hypothetical protein